MVELIEGRGFSVNISGIGKRIISLREQKDWSQRELAKRVDLNPSVMNRIELEERPIKDYELDMIASVLQTSTDYLLGRELSEPKAAYNAPEAAMTIMQLLGMSRDTVQELHTMSQEDLNEIKTHIDYIIYRSRTRRQQ